MSKTIYALLVGINDYHPKSKVKKLHGCLHDLGKVRELLQNQYHCTAENIRVLQNEAATRTAIISTFQAHLCDNKAIKAGDIVFFYYSGHGSYAPTATEFEKFDPQKQDESLVCYDSRIPEPGYFDLSDKELAVLISRIPEGVDIVFMVDACHSDSITRETIEEPSPNTELIPRFLGKSKQPRKLEDYLLPEDRFYLDMEKIQIPQREHIVFSACQRDQQATERFGKGVFTNQLLKILNRHQSTPISYRQLFEQTSLAVRNTVASQTPQIYVPEGFDINKVFLDQAVVYEVPDLQVEYRHGEWCLNHGAIYGLATDKTILDSMRVAIYRDHSEKTNELTFLGNVKVKSIKLKECHLAAELFEKEYAKKLANLPEYPTRAQKKRPTFRAALVAILPNKWIYLNGTKAQQQFFLTTIKELPHPCIGFTTNPANAWLALKFEANQIRINQLDNGQLIHGCEGQGEVAVQYILQKLQELEAWDRIKKLANPNTKLDSKQVVVQFLDERSMDYHNPPVVNLDYQNSPILYQLRAKNLSTKDLYIGLLYLDGHYGVSTFYPCELFPRNNQEWLVLDDKHGFRFEHDKDTLISDTFKIIISTEPFDDYRFTQSRIPLGEIVTPDKLRYVFLREEIIQPPESGWYTHTIQVNVSRN